MTSQRQVRIAAVGDLHFDSQRRGHLLEMFSVIGREANVLVLCGDLTTHGHANQMEAFVEELQGVDIPIVAVLGNHDFEADEESVLCDILIERGVHVLDGSSVEIEGIGFAGVKGFGGGFGRWALGPFGERIYKEFVQAAIEEELKLETALRTLRTETRVAILHYSPIPDTLKGEPAEIFPFLGSSRLLPPIETYGVDVVFHGHAHIGTPHGLTPGGITVYNVAMSVLEKSTGSPYRIWTTNAPDRRKEA
ncbi:MAG: metallophosphoesterase [Gemmatimonas sp.]|nr:metallophosphoesterase [Gemmatimonas sp.]